MGRHVSIGGTFHDRSLDSIAFDILPGAGPGQVLRYLAYRLAGDTPKVAAAKVMPANHGLDAFNSGRSQRVTSIPVETANRIKEQYPDAATAYLLRYQAALERGATPEQADEIARHVKVGGRTPGAKDIKPRKRRTRAEIEAAKQA